MSKAKAHTLPHLVIENVSPLLDSGRHPVKRSLGDVVNVGADIVKDGHDLVSGQVLYRGPSDTQDRSVPLTYEFESDRWLAQFTVDKLGLWHFTVEAWPDPYRSWVADLKKRIGAGQDITPELLEGASLVAKAARSRTAELAQRLVQASKTLSDASLGVAPRLELAYSESLLSDMQGPLVPEDLVRFEYRSEILVERELARFSAWYELFPRSQAKEPGRHGKFSDVEERFPELAALGFDVVYLPPIHPIGTTHRKGRNNARTALPGDVGSPWAIGSSEGGHDAVHAELGTLDDFDQMVRTASDFGLEIALDYALQCSPDHPWAKEHPEWFFVRPDGSIRYAENPPKKYEDIYPLNFWCEDREALWNACRDLLLFWIGHGVKIFRVDNPHTKPLAFWEWVIREVHERHPDVIFLSESFTRPKRMKALAKLGFSQSYTYFTWKNSSWDLREYLTELTSTEMKEYFRPNFFTNTPDILHEYLQLGGRPAFRIRLLLAATLSPSYGIYSGFELCENRAVHPNSEEYLNSEKYEIRQRNWNLFGNIKHDISKLNRIRRDNPALQRLDNLTLLQSEYDQVFAYLKSAADNDLIIVVNLDPSRMHECMIHVPLEKLGLGEEEMFEVEDLLTGIRHTWRGRRNYVRLDPSERVGHVMRLLRRR
ncbi:MAG TPA: alpha-1,4-glucan--maltose-1-phosphate maltosyltransferase [Polyangiaceae bacterium]|nr:alpha-1,4-glucan--maltose-1-phosphate maltosyltransferase [Polyangiaceae bacterium]